jgi:hypothetical protein
LYQIIRKGSKGIFWQRAKQSQREIEKRKEKMVKKE